MSVSEAMVNKIMTAFDEMQKSNGESAAAWQRKAETVSRFLYDEIRDAVLAAKLQAAGDLKPAPSTPDCDPMIRIFEIDKEGAAMQIAGEILSQAAADVDAGGGNSEDTAKRLSVIAYTDELLPWLATDKDDLEDICRPAHLYAKANTEPGSADYLQAYNEVEQRALTLVRQFVGGRRTVMQDWTHDLTLMQQSVLITAVRGPDGIRKDHPVKVLCRWLRRCILLSAFDRRVLTDPYEKGGGSFTGPCVLHFEGEKYGHPLKLDAGALGRFKTANWCDEGNEPSGLVKAFELYLRATDELPHHFSLHMCHAAEILGYKHPDEKIRKWWHTVYLGVVNDMHMYPESESQMDTRLGDNENEWRVREKVVAK